MNQNGLMAALLLAVLPFGASAQAQAVPSELLAEYERLLNHWGSPGTSITVVRDGVIEFQVGLGHTRVDGQEAVTAETVGTVASVTKTFGALAVSLLVADGAMSWNDPVVEHIPEFFFGDEVRSRATTALDLVTHRAGLPNIVGGLFAQDLTMGDLLERLPNEEPIGELRDEVLYSQVGVGLLGEMVSRVSGLPWPEFVEQRILAPLGMTSTLVGTPSILSAYPEPDIAPGLMGRVVRRDGEYMTGRWRGFGPVYSAAGGIATSGSDMIPYMNFFLAGGVHEGTRFLPEGTVERLWEPLAIEGSVFAPIINPHSNMTAYGTGWYVYDFEGHRVVEHPGATLGSAVVALVPSERIGVFILTGAAFSLDSERLVSALKFATLSQALGLESRDWISVFDR